MAATESLNEVFELSLSEKNAGVLVLVDSGACMSVCPKAWCSWAGSAACSTIPRAVTATGTPLVTYGVRTVRCTTWHGIQLKLPFVVSDVTRPIVAVADLLKQDIIPCFDPPVRLEQAGRRMPLVTIGPLYYLPVHVTKNEHIAGAIDMENHCVNALEESTLKDVKLWEYCCAPDSLLSTWFLAHGLEAQRLTLPDNDMSTLSAAERLLTGLRERSYAGKASVVWVALTCTAWCAWQRYNQRKCVDEAIWKKNDDERAASVKMLAVLNYVIDQTQKDERMRKMVDFGFEWPRYSDGWRLEMVEKMRRTLTFTGNFDGCMYGLQDAKGCSLRKPWRVVTTHGGLAQALAQRCGGGHQHGTTCGVLAKASAYYTPRLVQVIGQAICGYGPNHVYVNNPCSSTSANDFHHHNDDDNGRTGVSLAANNRGATGSICATGTMSARSALSSTGGPATPVGSTYCREVGGVLLGSGSLRPARGLTPCPTAALEHLRRSLLSDDARTASTTTQLECGTTPTDDLRRYEHANRFAALAEENENGEMVEDMR
jgi:hypothetical protein